MLMTLRKVPPSALAAARHPASSVIGKRPPSQLLPMPELTVYVVVGHAQLSSAWIHVRAPAAAPELGIALPVRKVRAPQRQAPNGAKAEEEKATVLRGEETEAEEKEEEAKVVAEAEDAKAEEAKAEEARAEEAEEAKAEGRRRTSHHGGGGWGGHEA